MNEQRVFSSVDAPQRTVRLRLSRGKGPSARTYVKQRASTIISRRPAPSGKGNFRRWGYAGSATCLTLALVAIVALGLNDSNHGPQQELVYGDALEQFPSETPSDVVSWSDQVSVVTAIATTEIHDEVPPEQEAAGEGMINQNVTFRVDQTIWQREGAPALNGSFDAIEFGWILREAERTRFTAIGTPWIEVGSKYLMPLAYDQGKWSPVLPSAVFPFEGGRVVPVKHQDSALAKQLSGKSLAQSETIFHAARPDPAAEEHFDLQPTARQNAMSAEQ